MANTPGSNEAQVFLNACLLDGDRHLEKRTRRGKRRALLISILLQLLFVAALVLIPLLGKSENIAVGVLFYPTVPYSPVSHHQQVVEHHSARHNPVVTSLHQPSYIPTHTVTEDPTPPPISNEPVGVDNPGAPSREGVIGGEQGIETHVEPPPSANNPPPAQTIRRKTSEGVQNAMLIHRVQPNYPTLAVQTRREGRVELHAIIASDGSIQSLEVISGDPFFIQSALAAVREWRYRPTILNGQPVEVETVITVVYTLSHE